MMTTMSKIMDMMSMIKDMRKSLKSAPVHPGDRFLEAVKGHPRITMEELLVAIPDVSEKTIRRHLHRLMESQSIAMEKEGKIAHYTAFYPQSGLVDAHK